MAPLSEASIIEHLQLVCDDKRNDIICQALLEHQQATNTTITVLERMDLLKADMKIENIFE